jgi:hypothetical protein
MSVITMNFVGITAPSSTHKGTYGNDTSVPTPPSGTEAANADYTHVSTINAATWDLLSVTFTPWHIFRFYPNISGAVYSQWDLKAVGYAYWVNTDPEENEYAYFLDIWNAHISAWANQAEGTSESIQTLTKTITLNPSYYIDGSGYIYLATKGMGGDNRPASNLFDDYVELKGTYTVSDTFIPRITIC